MPAPFQFRLESTESNEDKTLRNVSKAKNSNQLKLKLPKVYHLIYVQKEFGKISHSLMIF